MAKKRTKTRSLENESIGQWFSNLVETQAYGSRALPCPREEGRTGASCGLTRLPGDSETHRSVRTTGLNPDGSSQPRLTLGTP